MPPLFLFLRRHAGVTEDIYLKDKTSQGSPNLQRVTPVSHQYLLFFTFFSLVRGDAGRGGVCLALNQNSHGYSLHEGHDTERMIMLEKQVRNQHRAVKSAGSYLNAHLSSFAYRNQAYMGRVLHPCHSWDLIEVTGCKGEFMQVISTFLLIIIPLSLSFSPA